MSVTYLGLSPQIILKIVTKGNPSEFYWNIQINTKNYVNKITEVCLQNLTAELMAGEGKFLQ